MGLDAASASSFVNRVSVDKTKLIKLRSLVGASCVTIPIRVEPVIRTKPSSGIRAPVIKRNRVVFPEPLMPTSPQ